MNRDDAPEYTYGIVRSLLGGPRLLRHIKHGSYVPRHASLEQAIQNILKTYFPTDTVYEQGKLKFEAEDTNEHVPLDSKISLYGYTLNNPPLFSKLNSLLHKWEGKADDLQLEELWGDFIFHMVKGLDCLREGPVAGTPPPLETRLVRIAHIPDEVYQTYYKVGSEVLCKGFSSMATEEQWDFVSNGRQPGKTPVVIEYDQSASASAVDIRTMSYFGPSEKERLVHAWWKGLVTKKERTSVPGTGFQLDRVFLSAVPVMPAIERVLEHATNFEIFEVALMLGLHVGSVDGLAESFLKPILRIEEALEVLAVAKSEQAVQKIWKSLWRGIVDDAVKRFRTGPFHGPLLRWTVGPIMYATNAFGNQELVFLDKDAMTKVTQENEELRRKALGKADEELQHRRLAIFKRSELLSNSSSFGHIRTQSGTYIANMQKLAQPQEACVDVAAVEAARELEDATMSLWVGMSRELYLASSILDGDSDAVAAFDSPFPLQGVSELDVLDHQGDRLLSSPPLHNVQEAAKHVIGNVGLLRHILSRVRIVLPLGDVDAGKSTALRKLFGIDCNAGLGVAGRTRNLSLYTHPRLGDPRHRPIFIADIPGFGDVFDARDDTSRMLLTLATSPNFQACFVPLVFMASGRPTKFCLQEVINQLKSSGTPFEYVITKSDRRYEDMLVSAYERYQQNQVDAKPMKTKAEKDAVKEAVVQEMKQDDEFRAAGRPICYACLSGWASEGDDEDADDDDDDEQPKFKWINKSDVTKFFDLMTCKQLRDHVESKLGIQ